MRTGARGAMVVAALLLGFPAAAVAQTPGPSNTITDVAGVEVGQYTRIGDGFRTGTTVVLTRDGATTSYSSMGGGPGTKETDLLEPGGLVTEVQSVVLSGGSAFGLDTTTGVMRWLEERDLGYPVGQGVVPIVPGAILYDLGRGGNWDARPDAEFGYQAVDAATDEPVELGRVGAGAGASVGLGSASVELENGYTVGAIVGLNPGGSPVDPDTCLPYGTFLELGNEFGLTRPNGRDCPDQPRGRNVADTEQDAGYEEEFNTTIAVVATDAPLDQTQAQRMAQIANSGLSRSIKPVHNLGDGDTVFAMATTTPPAAEVSNRELQAIYNGAADALGRAVVHATLESEGYGDRQGYCERYPSACRDRGAPASGSASAADDTATATAFGGRPTAGDPVELVTAGAVAEDDAVPATAALTLVGVLGLLAVGTRRRRRSREA